MPSKLHFMAADPRSYYSLDPGACSYKHPESTAKQVHSELPYYEKGNFFSSISLTSIRNYFICFYYVTSNFLLKQETSGSVRPPLSLSYFRGFGYVPVVLIGSIWGGFYKQEENSWQVKYKFLVCVFRYYMRICHYDAVPQLF